ncbi:hypothetical protein XSR1_50042 [Xenorhabdus szentirmaii DSM 16338]|uniref:Uncharacterized protein n=1 Tax=Xenorhabdus szentirmaii DSM 16338 TaxID=1427518 RepID=W1J456_9GAMM|nr:hypothetical protein XSR1_50042 [Xenorhabdus szentirmaii DSM 16338]
MINDFRVGKVDYDYNMIKNITFNQINADLSLYSFNKKERVSLCLSDIEKPSLLVITPR